MHPFIDLKKVSTEEIVGRLEKMYAYMHYQAKLGHSDTVRSIKEIIESLELEKELRITKGIEENLSKKFIPQDTIELGKIDEVDMQSIINNG